MVPQNDLERIAMLLLKEHHTGLDAEEAAELEKWQSVYPEQAQWAKELIAQGKLPEILKRLELADIAIRKKLLAASVPVEHSPAFHVEEQELSSSRLSEENATRKVFSIRTGWFRYAAAIVILLGVGTFFWQQSLPVKTVGSHHNNHLAGRDSSGSGMDKAVLTLADGSEIILDNAENGQLATLGNIRVLKLSSGELKYENSDPASSGSAATGGYNTIATPKAGQFSLVLPDGSKVWLNATSSMTFPTRFDKNQRRVSISGEVYFEIAQDINKPFIVDVNGAASVEVLGTHFNINAYTNEPAIKTTLLEGKVKVSRDKEMQLLSPGEQAIISDHIQLHKVVDMQQIMAWKNGLFNFDDADIQTLMRELERWYDIKVNYQGPLPAIRFKGKMYRNEDLATVLQFLSEYGLKFSVEGKIVTVSN
ncbi:FecR domain-containing protein [Chitinophaga sp. MM2321]|uniref:FecR family protein n=1 Tax=Chitinophaga sp. MM2321 TaxID=3137178 RepID=UPI0032D59AEC